MLVMVLLRRRNLPPAENVPRVAWVLSHCVDSCNSQCAHCQCYTAAVQLLAGGGVRTRYLKLDFQYVHYCTKLTSRGRRSRHSRKGDVGHVAAVARCEGALERLEAVGVHGSCHNW